MKKIFSYHFDWSLLTIAFFSLVVSFFVFVNIVRANFPGGGLTNTWMEMNGWAWSPNIGWLSLNCLNDFNGDGDLNDAEDNTCAFVDYGLKIDTSDAPNRDQRAVGGCAWAGNVGWWVCFDDPDELDGAGHADAPDWGVYLNGPSGVQYYDGALPAGLSPDNYAVENSLCHDDDVSCHASILALEEVSGWSNELGFPIDNSAALGTLEGCFNCRETKTCSHDGGACTQNSECEAESPGSTCDTYRNCDNCLQYTYNDINPDLLESSIAGYQCSSCTFNGPQQANTICTENAYERNENFCTTCDKYYQTPGLIVDYTTVTNDGYGSMCGWAWNQAGSGNGVGWIQFSPRITAANNPYFQVNSGDIYAKGHIKNINILGSNIYNAFVIETNSNTIYNLYASSTLNLINRPLINFPAENVTTGRYSNVLGSLDYKGLITEVGETGKNKYGSTIDSSPISPNWSLLKHGGSINLGGNVFYESSGSFIADTSDLLIESNDSANGSGVVVINNTAILSHDIFYTNNDKPINLKNISSVVWIIKGDLVIDPSVKEISGTFIVFGEFNTGLGSNQLKVNGSVLAQSFVLDRAYSSGPSELFINDGRLKVNPPSGLQNFSTNLPKFTYQ